VKLDEIVEKLGKGEIDERDSIKTDTDELRFVNGSLHYLTDKGHLSEKVVIDLETLGKEYELEKRPEKFDIFEAFRRVADGKEVTAPFYIEGTVRTVKELVSCLEVIGLDNISNVVFIEEEKSSNHKGQKLTEEDAKEVFVKRLGKGVPVADLAEEYGVSERMVYYILDGTYWSTVAQEYNGGTV